MNGRGPSSPHTDDPDDSPSSFRDGRLLIGALVAIVVVVVAIVVISAKQWGHVTTSPELPPTGDPIGGRTSTTVSKLPELPTITATSAVPTSIGEPSPSASPTESRSTSSTTGAPKSTPASKVSYEVTSDGRTTIEYVSATGKSWDYSMKAGKWTITAGAGGRVEARGEGDTSKVSCKTATLAGHTIVANRSSTGEVSCNG